MSVIEIRKLGAISRQINSTIQEARALAILNQLEDTLDVIADMTVKFESMALMLDQQNETLSKATFESATDLEQLEPAFAEALVVTEKCYDGLKSLRHRAADDPRVTDDDCLVEAYDALLDQVAAFFNNLSKMAWMIGEQVADMEEASPDSYANPDELFKAIGV